MDERRRAALGPLMALVALAGCRTLPAPDHVTITQPPAPAPAPGAGGRADAARRPPCPPGVEELGVLVVTRATVRVNGQAAGTSRTVCNGDHVSTDATGEADIVVTGSNQADSIHIAANTDPRLSWTAARCISIDNYRYGSVLVRTSRFCAVIRTADLVVLQQPNSRALLHVVSGSSTELKALAGAAPVKLQATAAQVQTLPLSQLLNQRAPDSVQPRPQSSQAYRAGSMLVQPRALTATELRQIEITRPAPVPR